jgi:hypothetical protein
MRPSADRISIVALPQKREPDQSLDAPAFGKILGVHAIAVVAMPEA